MPNRQESNYQHHTNSNRKSFAMHGKIKTGLGNSRNRPCPCGSNLKYKKCHLYMEQGYVKVGSRWEKGTSIQQVAYNLGTRIGGK